MAMATPGARVLFLVVELCALTFRYGDNSQSNIVASALFGDGAAAALVATGSLDHAKVLVVKFNDYQGGTAEKIGYALFTDYLLPFEVTSVLILVAIVGAVVLARKEMD